MINKGPKISLSTFIDVIQDYSGDGGVVRRRPG